MPSLKVICPKCFKAQQVVVDIPPGGLDNVCIFCKTAFRVRPPSRSPSGELPAARDTVPRPAGLRPAEQERGKVGKPSEGFPVRDLPVSRDAVPRPSDLPVSRDAVPRPGDLPVSRDAVPRPSDLPVSRDAVPRPGDLPVSRDAVPRPSDLPVSRDAVPRPGDLPVSRNAVPRPGDLPIDRAALAKPAALPPGPRFPGTRPSATERAPNKTPPLGLALELSLASQQAAAQPLQLGDPSANSLDLEFPDLPPMAPAPGATTRLPAPVAPAVPRSPSAQAQAPASSPRARSTGSAPPPVPARASVAPEQPAPEPPPASVAPPAEQPFRFDQADPVPQAQPADLRPTRTEGKAKAAPRENLDLGFSLELEGDAPVPASGRPSAIPFPSARVANEGSPEAAASDEDVPALAPPTARTATSARARRPVAKRLALPRWAIFATGGVVLAVVATLVLVPILRSAPNPETVLRPFEAELANDTPAAYRKAADQLEKTATAFKDGGAKLQVKAAELLLTAYTVHGGQAAELARAEQLMQGAAGKAKLAPALERAHALLAVARGKPREAEAALADRAAAESHLVLGLAALAQGMAPAAADAFRRYVAARPNDTVGHYMLGKALLAAANPDARKTFEAALARNSAHAGAMIGLAQLEETPEKRLAAATALVERKELAAGPTELADLYVTVGLAAQALGRTPIAIDGFSKAITYDKQRTVAVIALGESLLYEGQYVVAMERLKAGGAAVEAAAAGKFCLGGAFIATGEAARGLALVAAASKDRPDDPRGPFWTGFAAHVKQPPDFSAAEQGYRDALKRDAKFLPASLKLAALLQQQNQAEESLTVLRAAEEAGAPPAVLQLAWGEALIVAKEPMKAEEVFQHALDSDPKSVSARLGVAAALEAQGKLAEAKVSLENSLKAAPENIGLRERLAQVCLKLGEKDEAMTHYQDELRVHATISLHLAVARLALDMGKIELAQSEAKKVLDESPRNAEAAYDMARVDEARRDSGAALQEYRRATTWGNTPLFALGYGRLLDQLGKQSEALTSLANAVALPEARMERGRIYFRNGDLDGALSDFQAATKMTPDAAEPLILEGLCYDKLGDSKKAEEAWRAALKVDPDAPEPRYRLGRTELDRGRPAPAIENLRKATVKVPDDADWRADLYFQLAQAELLTGAKAAALTDFRKFLDIAPPNAPTRPEAQDQVARLSGDKRVLRQNP